MALIVYWTQLAENKLEDIFGYYQMKAGQRVAQKLVNGIVNTTIDLGKNPFVGQKESLLTSRTQGFRYLVYKNFKIIYWINEEYARIEIANVFDCRQNPKSLKEVK